MCSGRKISCMWGDLAVLQEGLNLSAENHDDKRVGSVGPRILQQMT